MKHIAFLCGAIAMSGCAGQSEIVTRSNDLPGIPLTINCDPTPLEIYSKSGDLIEVKHPILHPTCRSENSVQMISRQSSPGMFAGLKFGPARDWVKKLEATDDHSPTFSVARNETVELDSDVSLASVNETASDPKTPVQTETNVASNESPLVEKVKDTPDVSEEAEPTLQETQRSKLNELREHASRQ